MADVKTDGNTRVSWVPTIAATNLNPTTAELNAGTNLSSLLTADGLVGFEPETADVDVSAIDSTFDTKIAGRASFSGTLLRLKKQSGTDTVYNMFVRDLIGYVVVRRDLASTTAWAASQSVEVYPSITGETRNLPPEANTVHRYEVPVKISTTPNLRATTS